MSDKRSVATDALETLGTIIGEGAGRYAIHLAVEPVIAEHRLNPGDNVGRMPNGNFGYSEQPLGIVDPFLTQSVTRGQRFWLILYPRQITSLRHGIDTSCIPTSNRGRRRIQLRLLKGEAMKCLNCGEEIYTPQYLAEAGSQGLRHVKTNDWYCSSGHIRDIACDPKAGQPRREF